MNPEESPVLTSLIHIGLAIRPTGCLVDGVRHTPNIRNPSKSVTAVRNVSLFAGWPQNSRGQEQPPAQPMHSQSCAARQTEPPRPRWVAFTWYGVAVISLITGHSCLIRLNITWLSWPGPHAHLESKAIEKCTTRGSYDSSTLVLIHYRAKKKGAEWKTPLPELGEIGSSILKNICPGLKLLEMKEIDEGTMVLKFKCVVSY